MAVHQHSTLAPERLLLREAAAPGRLLPAHLPRSLGLEAEFLLLMDLKRRTQARLDELVAVLDPPARRLPRSGLKQAAPGVFLFKGGRHVS